MGRCYGCCQENCGYTYCTCSCHDGDRRKEEAKPNPPPPFKPSGEEIRKSRTELTMSIVKLAAKIGVSAQKLSDVEHNRSRLSDNQYEQLNKLLSMKPRVSVRACIGYGGTFDDAISAALRELRDHGHHWSSWTVASHTIQPYQSNGMTVSHWRHTHRVVLQVTKGAKKT